MILKYNQLLDLQKAMENEKIRKSQGVLEWRMRGIIDDEVMIVLNTVFTLNIWTD